MNQEKKQEKSLRNRVQYLYQSFIGEKQSSSLKINLTRGAIGSFIIKITSTGLTLLISVLLARTLGAEEFGYYAFALAVVNLLVVPTKLGLPNLVIRKTAAYKTIQQFGLLRGILHRSKQAVLLVAFVLIILALVVAYNLHNHIPSLSLTVFGISLFLLPLMGLTAINGATLRGLSYVIIGQIPENIIRHGMLVFFIILFSYFVTNDKISSEYVMLFQVIATLTAYVVSLMLLMNYLPMETRNVAAEYKTHEWIKSAVPLLIVGGMNVINNRTDIIMLGFFTSSENVGVYQVVVKGAELVVFSLTAVNMTVAPYFSKFYIKKEVHKIQRIVTISSLGILIISLPIVLIFIFYGSWILLNIFGTEFVIGATALKILSVGQLINAILGSVGFLLNMTGHEKDSAKGVSIAAFINIILNVLFIPRWGIEGAALATATSIVIWNVLLSIYVYKRLRIYSGILGLMNNIK